MPKSITEIQSEIARRKPIKDALYREMKALEIPFREKEHAWVKVCREIDKLDLLLETLTEPAECDRSG